MYICKLDAQWYSVENGSGSNIYHMNFKDEYKGWYISDGISIYRTTNGGINWKGLDIPYIDSLHNLGPMITSSDTIWISADGNRIIKSTNGGDNWIEIHNNLNGKIIGFSFVRQYLIYGIFINYSNSRTYLIKSTNTGFSWNILYDLAYDDSKFLYFLNDSVGYYKRFSSIIKNTNYGYNWFTVYADSIQEQHDYMNFIDVNLGFFVKNMSSLYRTTNGGLNWQFIMDRKMNDVKFINSQTGYMTGEKGYQYFLKTTNRGLDWDTLYIYNNLKLINFREFFMKDNIVYINGISSGVILKSTNYGLNWIDLSPYYHPTWCNSISFANSQTGYIGATDMLLLKTTNSGINWIIDTSLFKNNGFGHPSIYHIQFTDENTGWLLSDTGLFKTNNTGTNWIYKPFPTHSPDNMYFINNNIGWLVVDTEYQSYNYSSVFKTTDGGNNFKFLGFVNALSTDIKFYDSLYGYISCQNILGGPNLFRTTNGGNNWQGIELGTISSICIINRNKAFVGQSSGYIYKTTDGGDTWTISYNYDNSWSCIKFVNENTGFATNYKKNICYTTNGGDNWNYSNIGFYSGLGEIYFTPQNIGFIVGGYAKIFRTDNLGGIIGINNHNEVTLQNYKLYQNFPNPFNPETTIKYSLPKNAFVTIKVYNILGKEITTLLNENKPIGDYSTVFNGSKFSSGVYFYSLIIDGKLNQVKKMIMIK
jgi:photosystem II stability/assembly factor-like uncharacterized protein